MTIVSDKARFIIWVGSMLKVEKLFAYAALALLVSILLTGIMVSYGSNERSNENNSGNCYNSGFTDGQDNPFDQNKYDECGSSYYDGFISGCMSVQGNGNETCESTTD